MSSSTHLRLPLGRRAPPARVSRGRGAVAHSAGRWNDASGAGRTIEHVAERQGRRPLALLRARSHRGGHRHWRADGARNVHRLPMRAGVARRAPGRALGAPIIAPRPFVAVRDAVVEDRVGEQVLEAGDLEREHRGKDADRPEQPPEAATPPRSIARRGRGGGAKAAAARPSHDAPRVLPFCWMSTTTVFGCSIFYRRTPRELPRPNVIPSRSIIVRPVHAIHRREHGLVLPARSEAISTSRTGTQVLARVRCAPTVTPFGAGAANRSSCRSPGPARRYGGPALMLGSRLRSRATLAMRIASAWCRTIESTTATSSV